MLFFNHDSEEAKAHSQFSKGKHNVPLSHEVIAAAASYEAAKAYAHHRQSEGQPLSHEKAIELIAGFTGAFVDRWAEQKGWSEEEKHKAKKDANRRADQALRQTGNY